MQQLSIFDLCGDLVIYRDLEPFDRSLPGLQQLWPAAGLPFYRVPRKREPAYAGVLLAIMHAALERQGQPLHGMLVIGDTDGDRAMAASLRAIAGVPVLDLIAIERADQRPQLSWQADSASGNCWGLIAEFAATAAARGLVPGAGLVLLLDIDKTVLGARGRDDGAIDEARRSAAGSIARQLLAEGFDEPAFRQLHAELSRSQYFPLTQDNQDLVVYTALCSAAGILPLETLQQGISSGWLSDFGTLLEFVRPRIPAALQQLHEQISAATLAGDPTPFKAFRAAELQFTLGAIERGELRLCRELAEFALAVRNAGGLVLAASDKPPEAAIPAPGSSLLPLHRARAWLR